MYTHTRPPPFWGQITYWFNKARIRYGCAIYKVSVASEHFFVSLCIVIREDGSHGMAIRPLRVSDAAALRLSMRAVNHRIEDEQTSGNRTARSYFQGRREGQRGQMVPSKIFGGGDGSAYIPKNF